MSSESLMQTFAFTVEEPQSERGGEEDGSRMRAR